MIDLFDGYLLKDDGKPKSGVIPLDKIPNELIEKNIKMLDIGGSVFLIHKTHKSWYFDLIQDKHILTL